MTYHVYEEAERIVADRVNHTVNSYRKVGLFHKNAIAATIKELNLSKASSHSYSERCLN